MTSNTKRIITGLALLIIMGLALYSGGIFWLCVVMLFAALAQWEFYDLLWKGSSNTFYRLLGIALGLGLMVTVYWRYELFLPALALTTLFLALLFLLLWNKDSETLFVDAAIISAGIVYVPVMLMPALAFSLIETLFLLGITVCSDTFAYFLGVRYGKHRIWPNVSPKKSVEGSLAGLLASGLFGGILGLTLGTAPFVQIIIVSLFLGIMAQLGDFFESALKRASDTKDSGGLLPGHGGILDRADSLLFVVPSFACIKVFWTLF